MQLSVEDKREIERKIVKAIIKGLDENLISVGDLPSLSTYLLENIVNVTDQDTLMAFLRDISAKWQIFTGLLVEENIPFENSQEERNKVIENISNLAKEGKVEEAIGVAKKAVGVQDGV